MGALRPINVLHCPTGTAAGHGDRGIIGAILAASAGSGVEASHAVVDAPPTHIAKGVCIVRAIVDALAFHVVIGAVEVGKAHRCEQSESCEAAGAVVPS